MKDKSSPTAATSKTRSKSYELGGMSEDPSWREQTKRNVSQKDTPSRSADIEQGRFKSGMSCYNCRDDHVKCQKTLGASSCNYCLKHSWECSLPSKSFQGRRTDRKRKLANPVAQHREDVMKAEASETS
ncbi:hypothetical protein PENSPDRAFT_175400 [Peniophora sp. CONT]|nr:hypothetical protein PENSPDRAFT_175400 [Peniophora sp. CONT]